MNLSRTTQFGNFFRLVSGVISRKRRSVAFVLPLFFGLHACSIKPEPLTFKELLTTLNLDRNDILQGQEPVTHPIDLFEAIARAWKYNLDYKVQLLEKMVALTDLDLSNLALLPKLAGSAGFTSRNSMESSSSYSFMTQTISEASSTSSDQDKITSDLDVVWNVLDFGVGYYQSKQTADRALVMEENRRKLAHLQLLEVQSAFWNAASAQELQHEIETILLESNQALAAAFDVEKKRLRPQLEIMRYQRAMLDIIQQLEALQQELNLNRKNLAKLLNLPPGTPFQLQVPDLKNVTAVPIRITTEEMEQLALLNRPELRQEIYNARVDQAETRMAMLRLLPGLEFKSGTHFDSNSFALNSTWETAGFQVTSNLMSLVTVPDTLRQAENRETLSHMRRLALNMAIISQVNIAERKYVDSLKRFEKAKKIQEIDQRILENIDLGLGLNAQTRLEQIQAATRGIMSRLQRNKAYAEVQNAIGTLFVSLGVDLLPSATRSDDIATLSQAVQEAVEAWNEGISTPPPVAFSRLGEYLLPQTDIPDDERVILPMVDEMISQQKDEAPSVEEPLIPPQELMNEMVHEEVKPLPVEPENIPENKVVAEKPAQAPKPPESPAPPPPHQHPDQRRVGHAEASQTEFQTPHPATRKAPAHTGAKDAGARG